MNSEPFLPSPAQPTQPTQPNTFQPIQQPIYQTKQPTQPHNPEDKRPLLLFFMVVLPILIWFCLAMSILCWHEMFPYLLGFFYLVHILAYSINNQIWEFLDNKVPYSALQNHLHEYFAKAPKITLTAENFSSMKPKQQIVPSHSDWEYFKYRSWMDISGTFHLDLSQTKKKPLYILLRVKNEISFADSTTAYDYDCAKKALYWSNVNRDVCIRESETYTYDGYKELILVRIGEEDSIFFSKTGYKVMISLSLGLLYILMFKLKSIEQTFVVRKLISTRYNLPEGENIMTNNALKPELSINSDDNEVGSFLEDNKMAPPSAVDLENAKMYEQSKPQ